MVLPSSWGHTPNGGRDKTVISQDSEESQTDRMAHGSIPERVVPSGVVFPYRGQEAHGVDPGHPYVRDDVDESQIRDFQLAAAIEPPEPIAVRVVTEDAHEIRAFRVYQTTVGAISGNVQGNVPSIIAGANERRRTVKVKNMDAAKTIYVGHDLSLTPATGWPIAFGADFEITGETAIYGISADGSLVSVAIYQTLAIAES